MILLLPAELTSGVSDGCNGDPGNLRPFGAIARGANS